MREAGHGELAADIEQRVVGELGLGVDESAGVEGSVGVDAAPFADDAAGDERTAGMDVGTVVTVAEESDSVDDIQVRLCVTMDDPLVRELLDPNCHTRHGNPRA